VIQEGSKTLTLIGVVLGVLMAFSCLAGAGFFLFGYRMQEAVTVSVPVTAVAAPVVLFVLVDKTGSVFINGEAVPDGGLAKALADEHAKLGDAEVSIAADRELPYQRLVGVIDAVKTAGFTKLALQAQPGAADGG